MLKNFTLVTALVLGLGSVSAMDTTVELTAEQKEAAVKALVTIATEQNGTVTAEQVAAVLNAADNKETAKYVKAAVAVLVAAGLIYVGYEYGYKPYVANKDTEEELDGDKTKIEVEEK